MVKKCHECGVVIVCKARCVSCLEKAKIRQRKLRDRKLSSGSCDKCGTDIITGKKHCLKCAEKIREKDRKIRESRMKNNLCSHCGRHPVVAGMKRCFDCSEKVRNSIKIRNERLLKHNLCIRCGMFQCLSGMNRNGNSHTVCQKCYLVCVAKSNLGSKKYADDLLEKLKLQNYKCPYTGDTLVLGDNAWVDHIMPRSKFPELANEIDNIEWTTGEINIMKSDKTPKEFRALINRIC